MTAYEDHRDEATSALDRLHDDIIDGATYNQYQHTAATVHATLAVAAALNTLRRAVACTDCALGQDLADAWTHGPQETDGPEPPPQQRPQPQFDSVLHHRKRPPT